MVDAVTWSIDLCNGWKRIGHIDAGAFDFNGIQRHLAQGEWMLSSTDASIAWSSDASAVDVDAVRLRDGNVFAFAGFVRSVSEGVGGLEVTVDATGTRYKWSGPDLWNVFTQRFAYPVPTVEVTSTGQWSATHDVRTGVASTVLAEYLSYNMGVDALSARQFAGFGIVNQIEGIVDTWSARCQPLSDLIVRICQDAEITCRPTIDFDGTLSVFVGLTQNLSDRIVLSDQGDLKSVTVRHIPLSETRSVVGGMGDGVSRVIRVSDSGATGADRIESFSDQSSLASAAEVQLQASTNRRLGRARWSINAEVTDVAVQRWRVGRDMQLGDIIAIEVQGVRYKVPITAASYSITVERQTVMPTLGDASSDALRGLIRDVGNLAGRFDRTIA